MKHESITCEAAIEVKSVKPCRKCGAMDRGKNGDCKPCANAHVARYRAENPDKVKSAIARWRAENPDKVKATRAKYRAENQDKVKAQVARYHAENPDRVKAITARWRAENPDRVKATRVKYRAENADGARASAIASKRKRKTKAALGNLFATFNELSKDMQDGKQS